MCVPGSPSLVGRKPGKLRYNIAMTCKLVTLNGLGGSNPSPGALYVKVLSYIFNSDSNT